MERVEVPCGYELPHELKSLQRFLESFAEGEYARGKRDGFIIGKREGFDAGYKKACELYNIQLGDSNEPSYFAREVK